MIKMAGKVLSIEKLYDGEVICGLVELSPSPEQNLISKTADKYRSRISSSKHRISKQLSQLVNDHRKLAIWGGTGKCAAFMHHYEVSSEAIPTVVDSDARKWGTYVPGIGQQIRSPSYLMEEPTEILIIPTQWRAQDILIEAKKMGLVFSQVLIEHNGSLIDLLEDEHPYSLDKLNLSNK